MEKYSRGRRGAPAKGIGRVTGARVQIPPSPLYFLKINCLFFCWNVLTMKKIRDIISKLSRLSDNKENKKVVDKHKTAWYNMKAVAWKMTTKNLDNWTVKNLERFNMQWQKCHRSILLKNETLNSKFRIISEWAINYRLIAEASLTGWDWMLSMRSTDCFKRNGMCRMRIPLRGSGTEMSFSSRITSKHESLILAQDERWRRA